MARLAYGRGGIDAAWLAVTDGAADPGAVVVGVSALVGAVVDAYAVDAFDTAA